MRNTAVEACTSYLWVVYPSWIISVSLSKQQLSGKRTLHIWMDKRNLGQ